MNVLVTGGAGFIGSFVVDALVARGDRVRILDSLDSQVHPGGAAPRYLHPEAELHRGDVRDAPTVQRALAGMDGVLHLAAVVGVGQSMYQVDRYVDHNGRGTAVLLDEVIKGRDAVQKLVVASSMSLYGEGSYVCPACGPVSDDERFAAAAAARRWEIACPSCGERLVPVPTGESKPARATSVYAITKRLQEELALAIGRAYGIPTVALRFFNVYGPRQSLSNPYTGVAAIFMSRLRNGRPPLVFEDGEQSRDFVSVHDLVRGILLALDRDEANGGIYNVGTGAPVTVRQIAEVLAELLGVAIPPEITHRFRAGDIRHCFADIGRIRRDLGYEPQVTLREGLRELVAWSRDEPAVDRVEEATEELRTRGLA
ncbi:MAG TPA: NAD-dependent epimerase/dehydratase family protein [Methylomirabilota bacterium]|nr:NAD-dependent epimerase/dehydratase family protein [Methylomirabilota bacterium]